MRVDSGFPDYRRGDVAEAARQWAVLHAVRGGHPEKQCVVIRGVNSGRLSPDVQTVHQDRDDYSMDGPDSGE